MAGIGGLLDSLFRPSRPDFIETLRAESDLGRRSELFRPSRPDFIETPGTWQGRGLYGYIVPAF